MGKIIWLASYPKSGNTWLRAFLHNFLRNPDEPFDINELSRFCSHDSSAHKYKEIAGRPTGNMTKEEIAQLRPKVHEAMTKVYPDNVFAKTHNALMMDRGTPTITMECTAAAIYVVRNPLDVAISLAHHTSQSIDKAISELAQVSETDNTDELVYEHRGSWSDHVLSWTRQPHAGLHVMRYEDAVADPMKAFAGVVRFLGLPVPPERLEKAIRFSSFDSLKAQEEEKGFAERYDGQEIFFRAGKAGQWREALTGDQVQRIIARHGKQMARFGYVPESN